MLKSTAVWLNLHNFNIFGCEHMNEHRRFSLLQPTQKIQDKSPVLIFLLLKYQTKQQQGRFLPFL